MNSQVLDAVSIKKSSADIANNFVNQSEDSHWPHINTNTVEIKFPALEKYKLSKLQESMQRMFKGVSADTLKCMLEHSSWETEAKLKLSYISKALRNALNQKHKFIIVIDRQSSVDWVYEKLLEALQPVPKLQERVGMLDHMIAPQERKDVLLRFSQVNSDIATLIVPSEAVHSGLFEHYIGLNYQQCTYKAIFFDALRNSPAAVIQFVKFFQSLEQEQPTQIEFLKTIESDSSLQYSFTTV